MSKKLLLISELAEDKEFATEVAATAGLELAHTATAEEGAKIVAGEGVDVIFVDASNEEKVKKLETAIEGSIGLFSDRINANAIHFLGSLELTEVPYVIKSPLFGHFIMRNYGVVSQAAQHYGRIVAATLADRAFGLNTLLRKDTKIQVVKLARTSQKQEAVEAVRNYLMAAKFQSRMATVVANAVDELLMNAMFDAPVDELGKQVLASTSRATVFELTGKSEVELHVGFDGNYIALTAVDHWGSLDKLKLLSHISKIYTDEEYKVRTSVAGAGIGLATVFRSGGSFFFVSENRARTEVTVFFRKMDSFRDFKDQFKFISTQFYF